MMLALHPMKLPIASLCLGLMCFSSFYRDANGFLPTATETSNMFRGKPTTFRSTATARRFSRQSKGIHMMMPIDVDFVSFTDSSMTSSSFHLSDVEIFDGSSIVDPVVVSNSYWSNLETQLLSLILGQIIATVVFAVAAYFLAPQLSKLRDTVLSKVTDAISSEASFKKPFIKAGEVARPEPDFGKLLICLLIDLVGTSSEALPILGEFTDVFTAPAAAFLLQNLYPGSSRFVFAFEFVEEILPFTDILPFATICWVVDTYFPKSSVADVFRLGDYSVVTAAEKAESIDISAEKMNQNFDNNTKR